MRYWRLKGLNTRERTEALLEVARRNAQAAVRKIQQG